MFAEVVEGASVDCALLFVPAEEHVAVGQFQRDLRVLRRVAVALLKLCERACCDLRLAFGAVEPDQVQIHLREFGRGRVLFLVGVEDAVAGRAVEELDRRFVLTLQLPRRAFAGEDEREDAAEHPRMRVGGGHVAVEPKVSARERETLVARVGEQLEELVEHLRAHGRTLLKLAARDERVEESRGTVAVALFDEEPRRGRKLFGFPTHAPRRPRLLDAREDAARLGVGVFAKMKKPEGQTEVGRVAAEGFAEFAAVGAEAVVLSKEVVELF